MIDKKETSQMYVFFIIQQTQLIDLVYLFYLILLNVSAVQVSHHQRGHGYTKRNICERGLSLQTTGIKLFVTTLYLLFGHSGFLVSLYTV